MTSNRPGYRGCTTTPSSRAMKTVASSEVMASKYVSLKQSLGSAMGLPSTRYCGDCGLYWMTTGVAVRSKVDYAGFDSANAPAAPALRSPNPPSSAAAAVMAALAANAAR